MDHRVSDAPLRLRLVSDAATTEPGEPGLDDDIRAARRSAARFLRALHASGHAITSWPDALVSRLAHADAVTARFLLEPARVDPTQAIDAAGALRTIEAWITDGLSSSERARLRAFELSIRIDADELARPLVQIDRAAAEDPSEAQPRSGARAGSLRSVLAALDDTAIGEIGRRLGLARKVELGARRLALVVADDEAPADGTPQRRALEHDIARVLRDEHLLGILCATLATDALQLLAAIVRGTCSADTLETLAHAKVAVGGGPRSVGPGDALTQCGLVYRSRETSALAVPDELRTRVDAVLQTLGI